MTRKHAERRGDDPVPEFGPAMRALHPRWRRAVVALFLTNGERTKALKLAGYTQTHAAMKVSASRIFADDRVRAAIREEAVRNIDIAEPEMLATTMSICAMSTSGPPALKDIAKAKGITVSDLVSTIDVERGQYRNLSSAIRVFVLEYYRGST